MSEILAQLRELDLLTRRGINVEKIKRLTRKKLLDLCDELAHPVPADREHSSASITHTAAIHFAGGRAKCANIECRMSLLDNASRLAALYSDKMYICNYFRDYRGDDLEEADLSWLKNEFYNDLLLFQHIQSLLTAGVIEVYTPVHCICPLCLGFLDSNLRNASNRATRNISQILLRNMAPVIEKEKGGYRIVINGSEEYFEEFSVFTDKLPEALMNNSKVRHRLDSVGSSSLSKRLASLIHLPEHFAYKTMKSTNFAIAAAKHVGASLVTDQAIDIQYLQHLHPQDELSQRNAVAMEHLKMLLPFFNEVPISKILALRKAEGDSFEEFRSALKGLINECYTARGNFTPSDAKEVYADVVRPRIATINKKMKEARSALTRRSLGAIIAMGILAFGVHLGAIDPTLSALGFYGSMRELLTQLLNKDKENEIRSDSLYFWWRLTSFHE